MREAGFWKIKQKLSPVSADPPMAKHDNTGNIITAPGALKKMYIEHYQERLKQREMKVELLDVYWLKTELWLSRLKDIKMVKSPPWNLDKLDAVLKSLKNNNNLNIAKTTTLFIEILKIPSVSTY